MAKRCKGKKIYSLEICFNDKTHEIEYIQEYIDDDQKIVKYGDINISNYFDDEGLSLIDEFYEVGIT